MNRLGFLILSILSKSEAYDKASAMTVREIADAEDFGYKDDTIYKKIRDFISGGYVSPGYKEGKQNTFFITEKGKELLKEA